MMSNRKMVMVSLQLRLNPHRLACNMNKKVGEDFKVVPYIYVLF